MLADAALRASEAVARTNIERVQLALAAGAIIGTWFWDLPTDRFTVDEAFAVTFGLDPELGREGIPLAQIVATVHPDDQAGLAKAIEHAIARGGAYAHQYRVLRADGRYYWIEANGRVDHAPDGTPLSFPGVLLDVEERRAAQEALRASEAQWRGLFEKLSEGFVLAEAVRDDAGVVVDWRYLEVNRAWTDLVGMEERDAIGKTISEVFPGVESEWIDIAQVVDTGETIVFSRRVGSLDRWFEGRVSAVGEDAFMMLFLDVTDRVRAEQALRANAERRLALAQLADMLRTTLDVSAMGCAAGAVLGRTLHAMRAGYGVVDLQGTVEVAPDWCAPGVASIKGPHAFQDFGRLTSELSDGRTLVVSDVETDPLTREHSQAWATLGIRALANVPVLEGGGLGAVVFVHYAEPHVFSAEEQSFIQAVADRTQVAIARLRSEERQIILNGEISHRLKNTLAMVQSITAQTLKGVTDRSVVDTLQQRLQALATAHDALLRGESEGADLQEIVDKVMQNAGAAGRYEATGPALTLGARVALSASLLLHELATNAQKYGALSAAGQVEIRWRTEGAPAELTLDWTERGGPEAKAPTRKGFGTRLLRSGLLGTGGSILCYEPEGFSATFRAPLGQVREG